MQEKEKKRFRLPHWLPFVLSLTGVAILMLLYIFFVGSWLGSSVPPQERFDDFKEYALGIKGEIASLSDFETAKYREDDKNTYFITRNGDEQALRDVIFEGAYNGESYFSETTGHRCARYYYAWYDLECIIIYDSDGTHTDGSSYSADIGGGVTAAIRGSERA